VCDDVAFTHISGNYQPAWKLARHVAKPALCFDSARAKDDALRSVLEERLDVVLGANPPADLSLHRSAAKHFTNTLRIVPPVSRCVEVDNVQVPESGELEPVRYRRRIIQTDLLGIVRAADELHACPFTNVNCRYRYHSNTPRTNRLTKLTPAVELFSGWN
jgi:hypothetical protein